MEIFCRSLRLNAGINLAVWGLDGYYRGTLSLDVSGIYLFSEKCCTLGFLLLAFAAPPLAASNTAKPETLMSKLLPNNLV